MTPLNRKVLFGGWALAIGLGFFVATWLTADRRVHRRVQEIHRAIEAELPIGTHADSVLSFLDARHTEHSEYLAKNRAVYAAFRNVAMKFPVSYGIFLRFYFDRDSRLASYQVYVAGDGP